MTMVPVWLPPAVGVPGIMLAATGSNLRWWWLEAAGAVLIIAAGALVVVLDVLSRKWLDVGIDVLITACVLAFFSLRRRRRLPYRRQVD